MSIAVLNGDLIAQSTRQSWITQSRMNRESRMKLQGLSHESSVTVSRECDKAGLPTCWC